MTAGHREASRARVGLRLAWGGIQKTPLLPWTLELHLAG